MFCSAAHRREERDAVATNAAAAALHSHIYQQINANGSIRPKCQIRNGASCFRECVCRGVCVRQTNIMGIFVSEGNLSNYLYNSGVHSDVAK